MQLSLDGEDIRSEFEFAAVGPQEVLERVLGLSDREFRILLIFWWHLFIAVVQVDLDDMRGEQFTEEHRVVQSRQEHMLVHELNKRLLWEV